MNKMKIAFQLLRNMGYRYLYFRLSRLILIKTGIFKRKFPTDPPDVKFISFTDWKNNLPPFLFYGKNPCGLGKIRSSRLEEMYFDYLSGTITFFGKSKFMLGNDFDWITNPVNGYKYNKNIHWSEINEFSEKEGDIKFVWEKARFSFLYDLLRYDYHYEVDCAERVFNEIISFIDHNPINQGPNYICSQEISLRVLNWTFALYFYKDSELLTESIFDKIANAIYWQIHHVYHNINFSRIAVRNNHALTETLLLYLSGLLFPFLPDVKNWSEKGKTWFEQEVAYQIYDDGTYLQFSNNYHRVVVQLLTLAIKMAGLNNEKFKSEIYIKAKKSLDFLYNSMDLSSGMLPNYGSNDGALFFKFNDQDFRDFRPQLQALSYALDRENVIDLNDFHGEDLHWTGLGGYIPNQNTVQQSIGIISYPVGGFFICRDKDSMTFIRCGNHRDRPAQADNLHIDIWYKGINVFRDNGSYLYNSDPEILKYFIGTQSHNTVMLSDYDQMLKGPRFIWYEWSQSLGTTFFESDTKFEFSGSISAFKYLNNKIQHRRKVIKFKNEPRWIVEDEIIGSEKFDLKQLWHINPESVDTISIEANDISGKPLKRQIRMGWYSSYYGIKELAEYYIFSTCQRKIITEIKSAE